MGITCKECSKGTLVFYDGGLEHNPKWICNCCGYEYYEKEFSNVYEVV